MVQQGADLGGVVFVAVGQGGGHDPAGLGVHAEMEMLWGGRWRDVTIVAGSNAMERPMAQQLDDLSRSLTPLEQDSTIIAVIEMSQASWLVAGIVPGIERHPLKKLEPSEVELLRLLMRWRAEATQKGRTITRIAV